MSERIRQVALIVAVVTLVGAIVVAIRVGPSGAGLGGGVAGADRARLDQLLARPASDVAGVLADASALGDPVLQQVAIQEWLHRNLEALDPAVASELCGALDEVAKDVCLRKVNSPHLRNRGPHQ